MTSKTHAHIAKNRYETITKRATEFTKCVNDTNKEPVRVFDPLNKQQLDELELIRTVSKELQLKKEEDIKKQAQAAATQAEEDAKKAAEDAKKAAEEQEKESEVKEEQK